MDKLGWLIGCMVLDVAVIVSNICEHVFIIKSWEHLDRIDHLLLSLSVSDLIFGLSTFTIDSWYLSRDLLLNDTNSNIGYNATDIATNATTDNSSLRTSCFSKSFLSGEVFGNATELDGMHLLDKHHQLMNCIFDALFIFTVFASVLHVMALAIERLCAVRFTQKYYIFTLFKTKFITIAMIWGVAITLTVITAGAVEYHDQGNSISRGLLLAFITVSVFVLYLAVAHYLFQQHKSLKRDFSSDSYIDLNRLLRLTVTCLFLGISYVICTTPIILNYFDYDEKNDPFLPPYFHYISSFLVTLNSIINPCIYFIKLYYDKRGSTVRDNGDNYDDGSNLIVEKRDHGGTVTTIVEGRGSFRSDSVLEGRKADASLLRYQTPMAFEERVS